MPHPHRGPHSKLRGAAGRPANHRVGGGESNFTLVPVSERYPKMRVRLAKKSPKRIRQRQLELRARLWPDLDTSKLWDRKVSTGFTTVPRTMPLILSIMDDLSGGQRVSETYLELWCRMFDESFVTLSKSREMAFFSGFTGERAERTWRERLKRLQDLGFIELKPGPAGSYSYALVFNPYLVIKQLKDAKHAGITESKYNALQERALEIGAEDLDEPEMTAKAPTVEADDIPF